MVLVQILQSIVSCPKPNVRRGKKYLRTFLRGKRVERQVKARLIQRIEHLRRRRYGQAYGFQQFDLREDLLRCSVRENAPRVHNDHALGADRFGHMMGDEHHGDAHFPVQALDGRNDLLAPVGVEHGGRLIEYDAARPHGDDSRNGHALLLPAGEQVRRV